METTNQQAQQKMLTNNNNNNNEMDLSKTRVHVRCKSFPTDAGVLWGRLMFTSRPHIADIVCLFIEEITQKTYMRFKRAN